MIRLLVLCEAEADFRAARILSDRVLRACVEWLRDQRLDDLRQWIGLDDAVPFVRWAGLKEELARRGLRVPRVFGHFGGEPGAPDAQATRLALLAFVQLAPDAVVLLRDADAQAERRAGLEQGRNASNVPFPVVIGMADPKREAWVLSGFRPRDAREQERLATQTRSPGFDPTREPHRLRGRNDARDIKQVLGALTEKETEREDECLEALSLSSERQDRTGVGAFLEELRTRLVPLFDGQTS